MRVVVEMVMVVVVVQVEVLVGVLLMGMAAVLVAMVVEGLPRAMEDMFQPFAQGVAVEVEEE